MRADAEPDAIHAWLAFNIADGNLCSAQRPAPAHFGVGIVLVSNVLADPLVQLKLQIGALFPGADLLALQYLEVVGQTVDDKQVGQLGAEPVIQLGSFAFFAIAEEFGLLC